MMVSSMPSTETKDKKIYECICPNCRENYMRTLNISEIKSYYITDNGLFLYCDKCIIKNTKTEINKDLIY